LILRNQLPNSKVLNLFLYGTLTHPDVFKALTGISPKYEKAVLPDFFRSGIKGKVYPGIIHQREASVEGKLVRDLDQRSIGLLDRFEGVNYCRSEVWVEVSGGLESAMAYVWAPELMHLTTGQEWDPSKFMEHDLNDYLVSCRNRSGR
jgi:gamma-glutamylcyclotransferase (GGCT)/AIG2-like uncharacterized protein YtfP